MRNGYIPWLFSGTIVFFVLFITMNKHSTIMADLERQRAQIMSLQNSAYDRKNPGVMAKKSEINVKKNTLAEEPIVPLKGSFAEERKFVVSAQDFKPDKLKQDREELDYKSKLQTLIDQKVPADNPELVKIIRNYYMQQPSTEPYNLDNPQRLEFSHGQSPFVDSRLNFMEGGFYVECGALNGEKGSNSLFFERVRKWNGLLIEGDPSNYEELKKRHRKAFSINACLSPRKTAAKVNFNKAFNMGRAIHNEEAERWMRQVRMKKDMVEMECFPLYSMMLALNRTTIDFFSLDVEGDEYNVLQTIPFDKLDIKMLTVEYAHGGSGGHQIQRFLEGKGYEVLLKMSKDDWGINDLLFRKKGLKH